MKVPMGPNKVSQNTFKNTPKYDLNTFCDQVKYRSDFY